MDKNELFSRIHLFENISRKSKAALADICLQKILQNKEILFIEGDKGYSLYILVSGNIQLYKTTPDGKEVVIKVVKPGELFGEVILFEQAEYPVTAIALKEK